MELYQLQTFQKVAAHKSFSKAAAELHLTQPAVTFQIKSLEEELGELLLERLGRNVLPTPAGEVLLTYVQQILNLTETAKETIRQFSTVRGRLTIGAGTTTIIFRLPDILQQFHQTYPLIELQIRSGDSELISKLVYENSIDLGLITTQPTSAIANFLHIVPLFEDPIWLVGPPNHIERINFNQFNDESLILFREGFGFRRFLDEQFQTYQYEPKIALELESMEAIIRMVQSGLGLAFLPEVAVREEMQLQKLSRIQIEGWRPMVRHTDLVFRKDKYLAWPVRSFLTQVLGENWQENLE